MYTLLFTFVKPGGLKFASPKALVGCSVRVGVERYMSGDDERNLSFGVGDTLLCCSQLTFNGDSAQNVNHREKYRAQ